MTATEPVLSSRSEAPAVGERLPAQRFGPFGLEQLRSYSDVSGDSNPIHLDPELARRAGLPAPPVQGMFLMGLIAPAIALWRPELVLSRLSVKFLRPVFLGEQVELSGRVAQIQADDTAKILLRLTMHNGKRELALLGEAVVSPNPFPVR